MKLYGNVSDTGKSFPTPSSVIAGGVFVHGHKYAYLIGRRTVSDKTIDISIYKAVAVQPVLLFYYATGTDYSRGCLILTCLILNGGNAYGVYVRAPNSNIMFSSRPSTLCTIGKFS